MSGREGAGTALLGRRGGLRNIGPFPHDDHAGEVDGDQHLILVILIERAGVPFDLLISIAEPDDDFGNIVLAIRLQLLGRPLFDRAELMR